MDVWLWISELPNSLEWATSTSPLIYQLASSSPAQSIELRAERVTSMSGSDTSKWVTFSIHLQGFEAHTTTTTTNQPRSTLWISDTCPLPSDKPFLPLVLQLLQEIVDRSPAKSETRFRNLKPDPVSYIMDTHSPESFSTFFALLFLTRLFWLCSFDAPAAVGSLYFNSFLEPNLELLARETHVPIMRAFLLASGVDVERCVARSVGYMLVKCSILREMRVGGLKLKSPFYNLGLSYATEAHGVWQLKSYAPVWSMKHTRPPTRNPPLLEAKESALRYTLAHQQLESVVQLEYSLKFSEDHIEVRARVDNLRFHVVKLGFNNRNDDVDDEDVEYSEETYFPSRIRVWIGPESGSNYVTSLSLGKSTGNVKREVEVQRTVKGNWGKMKGPRIKATSRTSTRMKMKNWRWDQDAEGNIALYDGILYDTTSGVEVYKGGVGVGDTEFRRRYEGGNRAFTKSKGLVIEGDECGEEVRWRVSKEMEESVLKWRVGGKVWVSYLPSRVKSCYCETRCVEWYDEVVLPLMPTTN